MGKINAKYVAVIIIILAVLIPVFIYVYIASQSSAGQQRGQGLTVVDDEGYTTTLQAVPKRIISLAPSVTPILYEIRVGDKVVGLTQYDDYPYNFSAWFAAGNMTCVGGFSTPNMETIMSLEPDLIFSTNINDAIIPNLRELGYKVVVVGPTSINGIYQTINLIGKATGAQEQATALVNNLSNQISGIEAKIAAANITEKPKIYYEIYYDQSGLMTAGSGSWINDVITKAGGINLFGNETQEWLTTSSEVVLYRNPNVILLPTNMGTGTPFYGSVQDVKDRPGWSVIEAVKNDRIYVLDQDLFNEPGSRIADQVQAVAACLYPQLFNSNS